MTSRLAEVENKAGPQPCQMYIAGRLTEPIGGERLDTGDPGTGIVIGRIPAGQLLWKIGEAIHEHTKPYRPGERPRGARQLLREQSHHDHQLRLGQ